MDVSIIIPIYNVAPYIKRCIESVINQTYQNIECILVDDSSTDGCLKIVEQLIEEYNGDIDFKIIKHQETKGVSASRNDGIIHANGQYVFFLDSDDYLSNDCIEELKKTIEIGSETEMSIGNVTVQYDEQYMDKFEFSNLLSLNDGIYKNGILDCFLDRKFFIMPFNKLLRRDYIIKYNLFFEEGIIHEDYLWSFLVACNLQSLSVTNKYTYTYYRHSNSLDTDKNNEVHIINYSKACRLQAIYASKKEELWHNPQIYKYIQNCRYSQIINAYKDGNVSLCKSCYKLIRNTPFWRPWELKKMKASIGEVLLSLHQYLPKKIGYLYYMCFVKKYA